KTRGLRRGRTPEGLPEGRPRRADRDDPALRRPGSPDQDGADRADHARSFDPRRPLARKGDRASRDSLPQRIRQMSDRMWRILVLGAVLVSAASARAGELTLDQFLEQVRSGNQ